MLDKADIEKYAEEALPNEGYFIVKVDVSSANVANVFVDADEGVKISDCTEISRKILSNYDRDIEDFELNVSSAGFTSPFLKLRQYKKNIGRAIEVLTIEGEKHTGILNAVSDENIQITLKEFFKNKKKKKNKEEINLTIDFEQIKTAKGIVTF